MSMRWRKVAGDMRMYRGRLLAIALVLVVSAAAVIAALDARTILKREISASFLLANAPDIALSFERVEEHQQRLIAAQEGVAATGARRAFFTRIAVRDGSWLPVRVSVVPDFAAQGVATVHLHDGAWPGGDGSILIEQSAQSLLGSAAGAKVKIRRADGETLELPLGAWVHDTAVAPSTQERMLYAYVTPGTAALLAPQSAAPDQLLVKMTQRGSASEAYEFGNALLAALEHAGMPALRMEVLAPTHPHKALMNAMLNVLGVLAVMALLAGTALTGYLIAAWMKKEVRLVGVMKTLGARTHQIAMQYLTLAAPLALLAMAIARPLGAQLGRMLAEYYAVLLNIELANRSTPQTLLQMEILCLLALPLLAMALPIWRAARVTPMAAMHDAGITALPAAGRLAARLLRFPGRVRWTLASRNIWRRPWRLSFMLAGFTFGGALFMTTCSNYESLTHVLDRNLAQQGHDLEVLWARGSPGAPLEQIAGKVRGVTIAEAWRRATLTVTLPATTEGASRTRRVTLTAYPEPTRLFTRPITQGRAPRAGTPEVLISRAIQESMPWMQVGANIEVQTKTGRSGTLQVVGTVEEIGTQGLYTGFTAFETLTGLGDSAASLRVKIGEESMEAVANALDQAFLDAHLPPAQIVSRNMVRDALDEHFSVVGEVMRMVALAAVLLGAIVLVATTSLNVMERTREIGVLRTLGGSPQVLQRIFLAEGAVIALLGAALSVMFSIPLTLGMNYAAEHGLLYVTVPMRFSFTGLAIMAGGVFLLVLAVRWAVHLGLNSSVRENLAYE